jgi:hypothetical protein
MPQEYSDIRRDLRQGSEGEGVKEVLAHMESSGCGHRQDGIAGQDSFVVDAATVIVAVVDSDDMGGRGGRLVSVSRVSFYQSKPIILSSSILGCFNID